MLSYAKEHRVTSLGLNHPDSRETNKRIVFDSSAVLDTIGLACNVRVDGLGSAHSIAGMAVWVLTRKPPCQESVLSCRGTKGGNGQVITTMSLPYPPLFLLSQGPPQPGQPFKFTVSESCDRIKEEFSFLQAQYHR